MANKIIKDTKLVREYSEDYRSGGYSTHEVITYFCSNCKGELQSSSVRFCSSCGCELNGIKDNIAAKRKRQVKPYEDAYDNLIDIRSNFNRNSIEYTYLTEAIKDLRRKIDSI